MGTISGLGKSSQCSSSVTPYGFLDACSTTFATTSLMALLTASFTVASSSSASTSTVFSDPPSSRTTTSRTGVTGGKVSATVLATLFATFPAGGGGTSAS